MTPEQERAKLEAAQRHGTRAEYEAQKFATPECLACKGRGWSLYGAAFPKPMNCHVCAGTGAKPANPALAEISS